MTSHFLDEVDKIDAAVQTKDIVSIEEYYPTDDCPGNPLENDLCSPLL